MVTSHLKKKRHMTPGHTRQGRAEVKYNPAEHKEPHNFVISALPTDTIPRPPISYNTLNAISLLRPPKIWPGVTETVYVCAMPHTGPTGSWRQPVLYALHDHILSPSSAPQQSHAAPCCQGGAPLSPASHAHQTRCKGRNLELLADSHNSTQITLPT